ncbi:MAG: efflux RND transporter periplasmic adaptor subunit [Chitinophagales bacterium]
MKNVLRIASVMLFVFILSACSNGSKEKKGDLNDKKAQLEKLKDDQKKLNDQIADLEKEIGGKDTTAGVVNAKLVSITPLTMQPFNHYVELQGKIDAQNISYVSPRGGPGQVKEVYVKRGDYVKKGQLLLKLEDAVMLQNLSQLETQLAYAQNIYDRQKNLWDQGIGTEVQYITAKNNVTQAQKQISTLKQQWELSFVRAEVNGVADEVNIHTGETFTGDPRTGIKIVNTGDLKATANIPENYISQIRMGTPVQIVIPDLNNKEINSTVSVVSQSIDPNQRSFVVEAAIKGNSGLKPNQIATIKILDYSIKSTIVVPVNTVQTDENGKFVYVMEKNADKMVAKRRTVIPGQSYGDGIEIKSGLNNGDQLITEGYQDLYEGQIVAADVRSAKND